MSQALIEPKQVKKAVRVMVNIFGQLSMHTLLSHLVFPNKLRSS